MDAKVHGPSVVAPQALVYIGKGTKRFRVLDVSNGTARLVGSRREIHFQPIGNLRLVKP